MSANGRKKDVARTLYLPYRCHFSHTQSDTCTLIPHCESRGHTVHVQHLGRHGVNQVCPEARNSDPSRGRGAPDEHDHLRSTSGRSWYQCTPTSIWGTTESERKRRIWIQIWPFVIPAPRSLRAGQTTVRERSRRSKIG